MVMLIMMMIYIIGDYTHTEAQEHTIVYKWTVEIDEQSYRGMSPGAYKEGERGEREG